MAYDLRSRLSWSETRQDIAVMFDRWKVRKWEISTPSRRYDSESLSRDDRAVTLSFDHPKLGPQSFTIDRFGRPMDNLRALYLGLDSVRLNESRGLSDIVQEMYLNLAYETVTR